MSSVAFLLFCIYRQAWSPLPSDWSAELMDHFLFLFKKGPCIDCENYKHLLLLWKNNHRRGPWTITLKKISPGRAQCLINLIQPMFSESQLCVGCCGLLRESEILWKHCGHFNWMYYISVDWLCHDNNTQAVHLKHWNGLLCNLGYMYGKKSFSNIGFFHCLFFSF